MVAIIMLYGPPVVQKIFLNELFIAEKNVLQTQHGLQGKFTYES